MIPNAAQDKVKVDAAPSLTKSAQKPQNDQSQAQDSSSIQEALADGGHDASDPLLLTTETVHNTDVETSMAELFQKTTNDQLQTQSSPSTQETVAVDTVNASDDALVLTNETVQNAVDGFYLESQSLVQADESTNELKACQVDEFAKPTNKECLESEKEESKNDDVGQQCTSKLWKTQVETTVFEGDWSSMSIQDKIELDRPCSNQQMGLQSNWPHWIILRPWQNFSMKNT